VAGGRGALSPRARASACGSVGEARGRSRRSCRSRRAEAGRASVPARPDGGDRDRRAGSRQRGGAEPERSFLPEQRTGGAAPEHQRAALARRAAREAHGCESPSHRKLRPAERLSASVLEESRHRRQAQARACSAISDRSAHPGRMPGRSRRWRLQPQLAERVQRFLAPSPRSGGQEAAEGGADSTAARPPQAGPGDGALLRDRDDVPRCRGGGTGRAGRGRRAGARADRGGNQVVRSVLHCTVFSCSWRIPVLQVVPRSPVSKGSRRNELYPKIIPAIARRHRIVMAEAISR